jgi:hypothetical protein
MSSCSIISQSVQKVAADANGLTAPVREREIQIEMEDAPVIEPQVVARTNDGGFIVAGSGNRLTNGGDLVGGAAKYDVNGKELWRYSTTLRDDSPKQYGDQPPVFYGVAPMRDGSIYLCGKMTPHTHVGADLSWAVLTHVDASGHLISENLVTPSQKSDRSYFSTGQDFHSCIAWGDDVAIIGTAAHMLHRAGVGPPPAFEAYYWILVLDAKGKVKWEKLIPVSERLEPTPNWFPEFFNADDMVLLPVAQDLIFSVADGSSPEMNSEVIRLSALGEIKARVQYAGDYRLVRPVVPDDVVQLWGKATRKATLSTVLTLNERLEQVQRIDGNPDTTFAYLAYRLPDQSFYLFGINVPDSGHNGRSVILHVDRELHHYRDFEPITPGNPFAIGSYVDSGKRFAAAPIGDLKEFAVAMDLVVRIPRNSRGEPTAEPAGFKGGTILDFVKLK